MYVQLYSSNAIHDQKLKFHFVGGPVLTSEIDTTKLKFTERHRARVHTSGVFHHENLTIYSTGEQILETYKSSISI